MSATIEAARNWIGRGFSPIPVPFRSKKPTIEGWPKITITAENAQQYFNGAAQNIGILLGDQYGSADVDCDVLEATWAARVLLPETALIFGRPSKAFSHYLYRTAPQVRTQKFQDPIGHATLIELRGLKYDGTIGLQSVVPPSTHPSGESVRFEKGFDGEPANVNADDLDTAVRKVAAAALLARHWPKEGSRHQCFLALAGVLARSGWGLNDALLIHRAIYRALWGNAADRGAADAEVQTTFAKMDAGGEVTGIPSLVELVGRKVVDVAFRWLGIAQQRTSYTSGARTQTADDQPSEWPKPEPMASELPPVEAFSEDLLPESFRPLAEDVTERMQVPMDFPAVAMVLCLAGVVSRRAVIQPKANDTGWVVTPNLWGGPVAKPGFLKSPVIQTVTAPLNQIQAEWRQDHESALEEYARDNEESDLRRAAWKDQFKAASKKGAPAPDRPEDAPQEPTLRRLIVNDATFEALHQTMSENPAGILVVRDELTGWWSQLDRAGREGERAFCLQAWNGDTGHTIDRIGRGTIHVPHCCMSMLGGIQPGRLRSYLADALKDGPSNDGLIQRFQVLVWPDMPPDWEYVDRAPDAASEEWVARVFRNLAELDADNPARFRFAPDAQELFISWLTELEAKVRGDELHPALISHLSKYRSLMPSLALLFELADRAGFVGFDGSHLAGSQNFVSLAHARQAAAWCLYLESHARRIYSCVTTPQMRAARDLAEKIRQRQVGADGFFAIRDVYLKGWSGLDTPEAAKLAAEVLQDAGWIRDVSPESGRLGGRPSNRWAVNPRVWE